MESKRRMWRAGSAKSFFIAGVVLAGLLPQVQSSRALPTADPWQARDVVTPKQLADSLHATHKPVVVCVGFILLFKGGHVPGAWCKGPASEAKGLENLKTLAQSLDRKREVVLYCGCCPWEKCPNIRPAFAALKAMGFTHVKVMEIETDFPTNWTAQGYPTEKGS